MGTPNYVAGEVWTAAYANSIGMHLIKTQTIGTAVSSVAVTSAFSADYDGYKIIVTGGVASTNNDVRLTLGATTTGYYYSFQYALYNGTTPSAANGANAAYIPAGAATTGIIHLSVEVLNPYLSKNTIFSAFFNQAGTATASGMVHAWLNNTTSYTDFTLTPSSGTWTGGTIRVYGYRNSLT